MAVEYADVAGVEVFDLARGEGLGIQSFEEFLQGHRYEISTTLDTPCSIGHAWTRLTGLLEEPAPGRFHVVDRNCEHVARYVITGRHESAQIRTGVLFVGLTLAFLVLQKAG